MAIIALLPATCNRLSQIVIALLLIMTLDAGNLLYFCLRCPQNLDVSAIAGNSPL